MANHRKIEFSGLFLLLIFLISNGIIGLFHNHSLNEIALKSTTICDKAIYFNGLEESKECNHEAHFSAELEKCVHCILKTSTLLYFETSSVSNFKFEFYSFFAEPLLHLTKNCLFSFPNKGPPQHQV